MSEGVVDPESIQMDGALIKFHFVGTSGTHLTDVST